MKCTYCAADAPDDARFCPDCRGDLDIARRKGELPEVSSYVDQDVALYGRGYDFAYTIRSSVKLLGGVFAALGGIVAIVSGISIFYSPTSIGVWISEGIGVVGLGLGVFIWTRFAPASNLLSMLQEQHDAEFLTEHADVQFVVMGPRDAVRRRKDYPIGIKFQNCVNRTRKVHIRLDPCGDARGWRFTETAEGTLGPGEMGEMVLWAYGTPDAVPHLVLWVKPSFAGADGRTIRHGPAKTYEPPVSGAMTIAAFAVGSIYAGGGPAVELKVTETEMGADADTLPSAQWRITSTPERDVLLKASA